MKSLLLLCFLLLAGNCFSQDSISRSQYLKALDYIDNLKYKMDSVSLYNSKVEQINSGKNIGEQGRRTEESANTAGDRELKVLIAFSVLVFGLILIGLILVYIIKCNTGFNDFAFKFLAIILILTIALFLIVMEYSFERISFLIILLALLAGYVMGANFSPKSKESDPH